MLFNFAECPTTLSPPVLSLCADALGGIMHEGCAPCNLPAAPGHVPPARVCMADCIKHKQLYLIGLYPALITTNSQSLWTTLLAPATLQNKHGKSHSSVILRAEPERGGCDGDVTGPDDGGTHAVRVLQQRTLRL